MSVLYFLKLNDRTMKKSNWLYVIYQSFTSDLLFWIVIDNLFLSTVKGFSAFEIVLITLGGLLMSLILYPLTNLIVKKSSNKTSIILGSISYVIAITMFMFSNNIFSFFIAQTFYNVSTPFKMVSCMMLKNNLEEKNKKEEFIKWQSYGKLGYAIITLIVALFAGPLFNINPYLPVVLSLACAIIGLILSFIYSDTPSKEQEEKTVFKITSLLTNKTMLLIMVVNILTVGTYIFLHTKTTLLIQSVCEEVQISLVNTSLIISGIVFGSRLCRALSNLLYPEIYKKTNNKPKILITISLSVLLANICFAIGSNLFSNYIVKIIFIALGMYTIVFIRDIYSVTETKIITNNIHPAQQKQAFVLANIYEKTGRLFSHLIALIVLGIFSLNMVYVAMLILSVSQIFACITLSKYLNDNIQEK